MRNFTLDIYTISRCTHNHYARELRKLGISMGQFPFIMGIAGNDGISQEKLSRRLMISKSTTAMIVRQLLNSGLITREEDELDRRNFRLHATAAGLVLVPKIEKIIDRCHALITAGLNREEKSELVRLTRRVRSTSETELIGAARREESKKRQSK